MRSALSLKNELMRSPFICLFQLHRVVCWSNSSNHSLTSVRSFFNVFTEGIDVMRICWGLSLCFFAGLWGSESVVLVFGTLDGNVYESVLQSDSESSLDSGGEDDSFVSKLNVGDSFRFGAWL